MRVMPKKAKAKSDKIVKFVKAKTSKNITLDKLPNGELIISLEHYKTKDYERMFTIDDVLLLIPNDPDDEIDDSSKK